jgi:uncharacterized repeat protein (TIGR03803 family)
MHGAWRPPIPAISPGPSLPGLNKRREARLDTAAILRLSGVSGAVCRTGERGWGVGMPGFRNATERPGSGVARALGLAALAFGLGLPAAAGAQPTLKTLYNFTGSFADGGTPRSTLVIDQAGNLYGTSSLFGAGGYVYKLSPPVSGQLFWNETTIYTATSVADAPSGLVTDGNGILFGTTSGGYIGTQFYPGTVFALVLIDTTWQPYTLHEFIQAYDVPATLLRDPSGNLFGVTANGGTNNGGEAFELSEEVSLPGPWLKRVLFNFPAGLAPRGGLVADAQGHLFGTSTGGGPNGYGTVYALTSVPGLGWVRSVLYKFTGQADGADPLAALVFDQAGNLYGTASAGGSGGGGGSVFELSPPAIGAGYAWTETTLYSFGTGVSCKGGLVLDQSGNLYGTTSSGGTYGYGTVFELSPPASPGAPWTKTVLYRFTGLSDGGNPLAGLTFDQVGNLYGTTSTGGSTGAGTVFEITP